MKDTTFVNKFVELLIKQSKLEFHRKYVELMSSGVEPSCKDIWTHNSAMLDLDNTASEYARRTSVINADDSVGCVTHIRDGTLQKVITQPRNEAWWSIANSTLSIIADDWGSYIDSHVNGTEEEWEEFVGDFEKYAV